MEWWNGGGGGKREKRGEGGAGERLWLIAFFVVLQWFVLQNHWVLGGEMTRQAQTVHHWHEDNIKFFPLFSQESEQVATWGLILSGHTSTHGQTKAGKMRWSPVQGFMSHCWAKSHVQEWQEHYKIFFNQSEAVLLLLLLIPLVESAMLGYSLSPGVILPRPSLSLLCAGSSEQGGQILPR